MESYERQMSLLMLGFSLEIESVVHSLFLIRNI